MRDFDYLASAELYAAERRGGLKYRRFPRASEAIRYAIENLTANQLIGSRLEVEGQPYDGRQIRELYESDRYPLPRKIASS